MTANQYSFVCNRHVESVLLWPEKNTVKHVQEFQFSLKPSKPGFDRTEDATHYRCGVSRDFKLKGIRYKQEKTITPYQVTKKSKDKFRSTLNVDLVKSDNDIQVASDRFKRGLEICLA